MVRADKLAKNERFGFGFGFGGNYDSLLHNSMF